MSSLDPSKSLEEGMTNATITGAENEEDASMKSATATAANDANDANDANAANANAVDANNNEEDDTNDSSVATSSTSSDNDDDDDDDDMETSPKNKTKTEDPMTLITRALTNKEKGNEHFSKKEYTKASRSYRKGVNLIKHLHSPSTNSDEQITSLLLSLQSNLCMVYYKLENYTKSKEIADYIISNIDSKNSKAYYRRGLSHYKLLKLSNAKHDLYQALQYNPKDKAINKEFRKVKKEYDMKVQKQQKDKQKQKNALARAFSSSNRGGGSILYNDREEELKKKQEKEKEKKVEKQKLKEKRKADWEDDCVKRLSNDEEVVTFEEYEKNIKKQEEEEDKVRKKAKKEQDEEEERRRRAQLHENSKRSAKVEDSDDDDDLLTESELQSLRGYKKTSDGRTTSYFSREQTEEEKKLLGSIAPKKLESVSVSPGNEGAALTAAKSSTTPQGADSSVWNQAGTWEEKDTSEWCNSSLQLFLKNTNVSLQGVTADVTKVENLKGDASVAFVSGKKRYVFDYSAELSYEIRSCITDGDVDMDTGDKNIVIAKGKLHLPDISSASISDEEVEVQISKWKKSPKDIHEETAIECRKVLLDKVREQVLAFVGAFNSQY